MGYHSIKNNVTNQLFTETQFLQAKVVGEGNEENGNKTYNIKIIYGNDLSGQTNSGPQELYKNVKMASCDPTKGDSIEIGDTVIVTFLDKDYNNPTIVTSTSKTIAAGTGATYAGGGAEPENSEDKKINTEMEGTGSEVFTGDFTDPHPGAYLTSKFRTASRPNHNGVDLSAGYGVPIYAAAAGKIYYKKEGNGTSGWGYYVEISHSNDVLSRYAHCGPKTDCGNGRVPTKGNGWNLFEDGSTVAQGQIIAYEGNTGLSRGANGGNHTHFEITMSAYKNPKTNERGYVDPEQWVKNKNWKAWG